MSGANELTREVDIDISGLLGHIWKKKWLILALTLIAGAIILFSTSNISPRYKSNARILIEKRESVFTRRTDGDFNLTNSQLDREAVGSQVQVLSSDDIALAVIRSLDLASKPEFNEESKGSAISELLGSIGVSSSGLSASPEERLLKTFQERLTVYSAENSRVIVVEFWAKDPKLAQTVPNAIVDTFLELQKATKLETNADATRYLEPEINDLRTQVRDAERRVAEFRSNSDILVGTNNSLLATQQLSEVSSELSRIRAERATAEATAASIRSALDRGASLDVIPEVIANPLIQRLRERQVGLEAQISELSTTLLPNHPRLKALQSQVADFDRQIRQAARNIQASVENNVGLTRQREADLSREVNRLKAEASRVGEAEVELRALEREATAKRELLASYLTQFREASSRVNSDYLPVDARIISRAPLPTEAYFPKVLPFTIAGMVVMMILSMVGVLAWALLTGKAFKPVGQVTPDMVPQSMQLEEPPMRAEAVVRSGGNEYAGPSDESRSADRQQAAAPSSGSLGDELMPIGGAAGRGMSFLPETEVSRPETPVRVTAPSMQTPSHTNTAYAQPIPQPDGFFPVVHVSRAIAEFERARVACISPGGEAGSFNTVVIARALAGAGRSVALIDMTTDAISTRAMLGTDHVPGVRELLGGTQTLDQCLFEDRQSDAHVVGAGMMETPADGSAVYRLQMTMQALEQNYEIIVVDCGPADLGGLSKFGDLSTIVLVNANGVDPYQCMEMERQISAMGYEEVICVAPANGHEPLKAA